MQVQQALTLLLLSARASVHGYVLQPNSHSATRSAAPHRSRACAAVAEAADLAELGVAGLPLEKTVKGMMYVPDQKLRYQSLLFLAKKLPDMDDALMIEENRVPGCLSVVYVHATKNDDDDTITFQGTSDAQLTKGLVALLVNGLTGCTAAQIEGLKPEFIQAAGLAQSLTPGRNNGFLNMLALMKRKAKALDGGSAGAGAEEGESEGEGEESGASRAPPPTMMLAEDDATSLGPVGQRMAASLASELAPTSLSLIDESDQHAGHAGSKGFNGESHFAVEIVSDAFTGVRGLKRHQMIYSALGDDMQLIHALSIKAIAPDEMQA